MSIEAFDRVHLDGTGIRPDHRGARWWPSSARRSRAAAAAGSSPRTSTSCGRRRHDPRVRGYLDDADLIVADGMPLVWASRLARHAAARAGGRQQPDLVAVRGAGPRRPLGLRDRRHTRPTRPSARRTARPGPPRRLAAACPGLRIAGTLCPRVRLRARHRRRTPSSVAAVVEAEPDLVFVGLGFPKQETGHHPAARRAAAAPGSSAAAPRSTSWPATSTGRRAGCSAPAWSGRTGWAPSRAGWPAATSARRPVRAAPARRRRRPPLATRSAGLARRGAGGESGCGAGGRAQRVEVRVPGQVAEGLEGGLVAGELELLRRAVAVRVGLEVGDRLDLRVGLERCARRRAATRPARPNPTPWPPRTRRS